jgi:hypothetical protein
MGARPGAGRKATPTALKILRGNPGLRPLPKDEPKPKAGLPACPSWLTATAKREYRKIGAILVGSSVMTVADGHALVMIATSFATWVEAEKAVLEHGLLVKGRDGAPAVNPFRKVANEAYDRTRQLLIEFGMTPASRTRVKVVESVAPSTSGKWWESSG